MPKHLPAMLAAGIVLGAALTSCSASESVSGSPSGDGDGDAPIASTTCPEGVADYLSELYQGATVTEVTADALEPSAEGVDLSEACILFTDFGEDETAYTALIPVEGDAVAAQEDVLAEFVAAGYVDEFGNRQYTPSGGTGFVEISSIAAEDAAQFGGGFDTALVVVSFAPGQ
jgi:hypothetical protein